MTDLIIVIDVQGMSHIEAAVYFDCKERAITSRMFRARECVRKLLTHPDTYTTCKLIVPEKIEPAQQSKTVNLAEPHTIPASKTEGRIKSDTRSPIHEAIATELFEANVELLKNNMSAEEYAILEVVDIYGMTTRRAASTLGLSFLDAQLLMQVARHNVQEIIINGAEYNRQVA